MEPGPLLKINKKNLKCNSPKRTPSHKTKSHIVKACEGGKEKMINLKLEEKALKQDMLQILKKEKCQRPIGQIK